jgi:NAD(P)H dehydrogenase (quinone)
LLDWPGRVIPGALVTGKRGKPRPRPTTDAPSQPKDITMPKIVIVYHSGYGHTKKVAEAVLAGTQGAGAEAKLMPVGDLDDAGWVELDAADAIIFGAPTYMGGPSADFKKFADASSKPWFAQKWKDKVAAGFTNSATMNGDKFNTITYLVTLAMQHGMIWAGTGMMPSNTKAATRNDLNFVGGFTGLLAQSPADASPEEAPPPGDLETAKAFGARIATVTARWAGK